MVAVFVRVQDLGDVPARFLGGPQAFLVIQGVDGERLAGFVAGDQVIEVAVGVGGPNLFDDHGIVLAGEYPANDSAGAGRSHPQASPSKIF